MFQKHPILILTLVFVTIVLAVVAYIYSWCRKFVAHVRGERRDWLETLKSNHIKVLLDETVADPRACYECIQKGILLYKYTHDEIGCSNRVMLEAAIRTAEKRHEEALSNVTTATTRLDDTRWSDTRVSLDKWIADVRDADRTLTGAKNATEDKRGNLATLRAYLKELPPGA